MRAILILASILAPTTWFSAHAIAQAAPMSKAECDARKGEYFPFYRTCDWSTELTKTVRREGWLCTFSADYRAVHDCASDPR